MLINRQQLNRQMHDVTALNETYQLRDRDPQKIIDQIEKYKKRKYFQEYQMRRRQEK